jgi:glycosyltransferase involved in cell wall biosynthesis
MTYRFHVLGIPHTATNEDWLCCAYTQKVLKLCRMLRDRGHHVIHYGNEASRVPCEHVTVTNADDIGPPSDYLKFDINDRTHRLFATGAIAAIERRKRPRDFLLCMWGAGHKVVADAHADLTVVEPGIGYAGGHFAFFKVFESYAMLHAYKGLNAVGHGNSMSAYEAVIPNYFDPDDFEYSAHRGGYLLFLGRIDEGKGTHIAVEVAKCCNLPLAIAGPGQMRLPDYDKVEIVGVVDRAKRRELLANANALLAPSTFLEPFCGVVTEAHFSGTPTITHDWGAQAENNVHGLTGFRCRTLEQFVWSVKNIDRIEARDCRRWADNFTIERVAAMYDEYWNMVAAVISGAGWYQENPERAQLDWLNKNVHCSVHVCDR